MCVPHFIICSSVEGHLGCLNFLDIVHTVTMNMAEEVSVSRMSSPLGIYAKEW